MAPKNIDSTNNSKIKKPNNIIKPDNIEINDHVSNDENVSDNNNDSNNNSEIDNLSDNNSDINDDDEDNDSDNNNDNDKSNIKNEDEIVYKKKESFEEVTKKIINLRTLIKNVEKDISEIHKDIKTKEKIKNDFERQLNFILKGLDKIHIDAVNKARKEKKKRKGNVNGGFNKEIIVPDILRDFLDFPEDAQMARPKVMSAMNNKFTELKLKNGQNTTLNDYVVERLQLDDSYKGKIIKFTEFQGFLASFYPKKKVIEKET
jgi:hypothetical protein